MLVNEFLGKGKTAQSHCDFLYQDRLLSYCPMHNYCCSDLGFPLLSDAWKALIGSFC